ncbi:VIT1/CCC1 family predicted Fe2+/Mn2+ transporter [Undibacterium sp. GrIS 1.8]|uniref:VIT1/CCC1 transporter family protein n=1 Tax=Undibacterium sp. GrIS 1.8 TaxID=3143934 RepID=UPI003392AB7F
MRRKHPEQHKLEHIGWLRAAVLGANDGIVSTSSLILGVAASNASHTSILVAGVAGLVAGAMSMATGEYVSVQSQADTENAALETEKRELKTDPEGELKELTEIYINRGLDASLARQVAVDLMKNNALNAHARDELGISETLSARPLQAAFASAGSFTIGALLPLLVSVLTPNPYLSWLVVATSIGFLAVLGGLAAYVGGANVVLGSVRVSFWSALAMGLTYAVGSVFGGMQ